MSYWLPDKRYTSRRQLLLILRLLILTSLRPVTVQLTTSRPMFSSAIIPLLPTHAVMLLLVLLPTVGPGAKQETQPVRTATNVLLKGLQLQLGSAVRVLTVDAASHPAVVHAFDGRGVPAFVLLRDGEELFR
jgi:hypothetical protein